LTTLIADRFFVTGHRYEGRAGPGAWVVGLTHDLPARIDVAGIDQGQGARKNESIQVRQRAVLPQDSFTVEVDVARPSNHLALVVNPSS
jgi:hypothetical protein